jgi:hypothetical protein
VAHAAGDRAGANPPSDCSQHRPFPSLHCMPAWPHGVVAIRMVGGAGAQVAREPLWWLQRTVGRLLSSYPCQCLKAARLVSMSLSSLSLPPATPQK